MVRTQKVSAINSGAADETSRAELDSQADRYVLGVNALIMHHYEHPVSVTGYYCNVPTTTQRQSVEYLIFNQGMNGVTSYFTVSTFKPTVAEY